MLLNIIFPFAIIISFIFAIFSGNLDSVVLSGIDGADTAVKTALSLVGIVCFWSGILNIAEKGGAAKKCEKVLSPVISRLFPKTHAKQKISMNIIANMFGAGNAATPAGISAMEQMDRENGQKPYPSLEMSRFAVMNTASVSLFPTTVIGILSSFGAKNPFSIIPLVWICSVLSLFFALLCIYIFFKGDDIK